MGGGGVGGARYFVLYFPLVPFVFLEYFLVWVKGWGRGRVRGGGWNGGGRGGHF